MRNLRWSKRLWGRTPSSCASVDVVRTERGNTSKKEPTGTGDSIPSPAKRAAPSFCATTLSLLPPGSAPSTSGWYWSMVKSSGAARPSVTLRLKYTDSTRSTSPESLLTVVLSGNRICTGGKSPPRCGGSTNAALQSRRLGKSLTLCALTQDSSFRHLHVLELFAPHGLHRKPAQRRYGAYVFTDCHVFLLKRFCAISWPSTRDNSGTQTYSQSCPAAFGDGRSTMRDPFLVGK